MKASTLTLASLLIATFASASLAAGTGNPSSGNQTGASDRAGYPVAKTELIDASPIAAPRDRVSIDFVLKQPRTSQKFRRY